MKVATFSNIPNAVRQRFPTTKACLEHVEAVRWPKHPQCPYCGSERSTPMPIERRHHCNSCNTSYSATVGTLLHHTRVPLQKWFIAFAIFVGRSHPVSARQLATEIEVSKDTAWRMATRIRQAMTHPEQRRLLTDIATSIHTSSLGEQIE